jgi:hypothetical protein
VKIRGSSVQREKFLGSPSPSEADLSTFLLSCRSMRLLYKVVTTGGRLDLDVLYTVEHGKFSDGCPIAP